MPNLYDYHIPTINSESMTQLFSHKQLTINRIVSNQLTKGEWYDQDEDEWLVLLKGEASLEVEEKIVTLREGDTLFIPAHQRHRVIKTTCETLWLTIHLP